MAGEGLDQDVSSSLGRLDEVSTRSSSPAAEKEILLEDVSSSSSSSAKPDEKKSAFTFKVFRYGTTADYVLIAVGSFFSLGSGICLPAFMTMFGKMIDSFNPSAPATSKDVNYYLCWMVYMGLISWGACGLGATCLEYAAERQLRSMRSNYLKSVMRQEMGWFDTFETGTLAATLNQNCIDIREAIGLKLSQLLMFVGMFIAGYVLGLIEGWQLALVLTAPMPVIVVCASFMMKFISQAANHSVGGYAKAAAIAEEAFMSIRSVAAFGQEESVAEAFNAKLGIARKEGIKGGYSKGLGLGSTLGVLFLTYSLGFWYGSKLVSDDLGEYGARCVTEVGLCWTAGTVLGVFFDVILAAFALGQAGPSLAAFSKASSAIVGVCELLERKSAIDPYDQSGHTGDRATFKGEIEFRDVAFRYPSRPEKNIFRNISLKIDAGKSVALVGASGCGKSTLVQMIERYYDPASGSVTFDGRDAREYNLSWLRGNMAIVSQEPRLFARSIAANIACGRLDATREEIIEAGKKANAHDFISEFPNGYDTFVGESGSQLSGGQKQRIAIARAILRNPAILILDEATSALDNESESIVQRTLDELVAERSRTTIIIAHRLSTVREADRIVVLDNRTGEGATVIEEGNHESLMLNENGTYHALVTSQQLNRPREQGDDDELVDGELELSNVPPDLADKFIEEIPEKSRTLVKLRSKYSSIESKLSKISVTSKLSKIPSDIESEKPVKITRIVGLVRDSWWKYVVGLVGASINGCLFPVFGILFAHFIGVFIMTDPGEMQEKGVYWAEMFIILAVAAFLGQGLQQGFFEFIGQDVIFRLRKELFAQILHQDIGFFDDPRHSTGSMSEMLASDVWLIKGWAGDNLGIMFQNLCCVIAALGISLAANAKLAGVALAGFAFFAPVSWLEMKFMQAPQTGSLGDDPVESAGYIMNEAIVNIRTVAAYCLEDQMSSQYSRIVDRDFKKGERHSVIAGVLWGFSQFAQYAIQALCLWYGVKLKEGNEITITEMMQAIYSLIMAAMSLGQTMIFVTDSKKAKASARRVFSIIDRVPLIDARSSEGTILDDGMRGEVRFERVNFSYPMRRDVPIYRNLSFTIPSGKTVALVGSSGCGKSTTVQLLERFYDLQGAVEVPVMGDDGAPAGKRYVKSGRISIDGVDIRDINVASLRSRIGLVSQEPLLFSTSIAENIKLGNPSVTTKEIEEAATKANAHTFISKFPAGYDTEVGKFGGQLSGGQKQRIALARAILRDPKILVLDEATSALDAESEKIVQRALDDLLQASTRTTIVIAHRLSTVRDAHQIVVFVNEDQKGSLVAEVGTHDELMGIPNGTYRGLVMLTEGGQPS